MKNKLSTILIILLCLAMLMPLASCDLVLDLIFGEENPSPSPSEQQHEHAMRTETLQNETCTGQSNVTYYVCDGCGKSFVDQAGEQEIAEIPALAYGHMYVLKTTAEQHYRQCALCNDEQAGSRGAHASDKWHGNAQNHYKTCDVCADEFVTEAHSMSDGTCSVCGRFEDYVTRCSSDYGYGSLLSMSNGAIRQALYEKIDAAVSAAHDDATFDCKAEHDSNNNTFYAVSVDCKNIDLTPDEAMETAAVYRHDHPLYYWFDRNVYASYNAVSGLITGLKISVLDEYANGKARVNQNESIYVGIDEYVANVHSESNDYYKTLALHDEMIDNIDYAYKSDGKTAETESWAHSIEGVFVNKSAVCEGYAKTFNLLLNACGIPNVYVTGESRGEGHAWNMVQLDGGWYWYDLTWDDQPYMGRGVIYNYFCKSDADFLDHTVGSQTGLDYLYQLPVPAQEKYQSDDLEMKETFVQDGLTYELCGYNRVAVKYCSKSGEVEIPSRVTYNGRTYAVTQISASMLNMTVSDVISAIVGVTKLTLPETVDVIYTASLADCLQLKQVVFADTKDWYRYAQNGLEPDYEPILSESLSNPTAAKNLVKQGGKYTYVWVKKGSNVSAKNDANV